jgi:hypothetical protein
MRFFLFITATIISWVVVAAPLFLYLEYKSDVLAVLGMFWFLIIGAANQWIQHRLESIL